MVLEYLWGGRLHTLSGCSVPVQDHYTVKNSSSCSGETSVHQFLPIALVLLLGTTTQSLVHPSGKLPSDTDTH